MNSNIASNSSSLVAFCQLRMVSQVSDSTKPSSQDQTYRLESPQPLTLNPNHSSVRDIYGQRIEQIDDIQLTIANQIDLDQITLSGSESKTIERFWVRKNYAITLTKKKEPLYWGEIINPQVSAGGSSTQITEQQPHELTFIETMCNNQSETQHHHNEYSNEEYKLPTLLSKRISFHFLSDDGMLYSMGKDTKKYGLLGLGSVYEITNPCPNNNLIDYRIQKIAMGLSHCQALTSGGQLYTWGTGQNGQLCLQDETMFSNIPKLVPNSKNMNIQNIYCSSYYTLILNSSGQISMYGTLKGFAKFLFDSPSRDHSRSSDIIRHKLDLPQGEVVTKLSLAEKAFAVYCENSHNLYYVNEIFEPICILRRDLKNFQFVNGQKYLVAQDKNNILIVMGQIQQKQAAQDDSRLHLSEGKWQIIKEFNLIQEFGTADVDLLPQDTSVATKKSQSLQILTFQVSQSNSKIIQNLNTKYYKSFLTTGAENEYQNNPYVPINKQQRLNRSPYSSLSSFQDIKTSRNKIQIKLDSIFGTAFSAKKDRSTSSKIKERAKKIHQSLSPISRFPMINNLVEKIKQHQQKISSTSKSPPKNDTNNLASQTLFKLYNQNNNPSGSINNYNEQLNSSQYSMLLKSFNIACQLTSLGNTIMDGQTDRQMKFMSKAEKIRQELTKKQQFAAIANQINKNNSINADNHDMIEMATPDVSRQSNVNNGCNMPMQISNCGNNNKNDDMPRQQQCSQNEKEITVHVAAPDDVQTQNYMNQNPKKNLSCIFEDKENNRTSGIHQMQMERDFPLQGAGKQRPPSMYVSHNKNHLNLNEAANLDTISDISGMGGDSHRFSLTSAITHTNNYKILVMNARNVIEKKILQHLMIGFNSIKYADAPPNGKLSMSLNQPSYAMLDSTYNIYHQNELGTNKLDEIYNGLTKIDQFMQNQKQFSFKQIHRFSNQIKHKNQSIKKLVQILKSKQEQLIIDAMRKIQLSIRLKKLQKLNINLFVNCVNQIVKKQAKWFVKDAFATVKCFSLFKRQQLIIKGLEKCDQVLTKNEQRKALIKFQSNLRSFKRKLQSIKLLKTILKQINYRKNLNLKSKAFNLFRNHLTHFNSERAKQLSQVLTKTYSKKFFKEWHVKTLRRKIAVQQAIFLKMFIQDKLKQIKYYTLLKILHFNNAQSVNQSKKSYQGTPVTLVQQEIILDQAFLSENSKKQTLELAEKSIQNDLVLEAELDIEDTQLDDDYYYCGKSQKSSLIGIQKKPLNSISNFGNNQQQPKKGSGKEFSFDKNEIGSGFGNDGVQFATGDNNMTAHFNKNTLMSKQKESNNKLFTMGGMHGTGALGQTSGVSEFQISRPHYHCHYTDQEKDAPEAFTLHMNSSSRQSLSINNSIRSQDNKENLDSQSKKIQLRLQNEISPSNNYKHYQRQINLCKNYEQSDPLELGDENGNEFMGGNMQMQGKQESIFKTTYEVAGEDAFIASCMDDDQQQFLRSYNQNDKNFLVIPFNPPEDTPSDHQLRTKTNQKENERQQRAQQLPKQLQDPSNNYPKDKQLLQVQSQVFQQKKDSVKSNASNQSHQNQSGKPFLNNYFMKLSAQNSSKQENQKSLNNSSLHQSSQQSRNGCGTLPQQQNFTQPSKFQSQKAAEVNHLKSHQPQQNPQMNQTSFITTSNNPDIMHFHSSSDASFVFFDDNFWRDSGSFTRISGLSRLGQTINSQQQPNNQQFYNQLHSQAQHQQQQQFRQQLLSHLSQPQQYQQQMQYLQHGVVNNQQQQFNK